MPRRAIQIAEQAPTEAAITDYDRAHCSIYLRLIDAANAKAPWPQVARIVLGLDPENDIDRAKSIYDSHFARARWMVENGFRDLLREKP
jgi:hypothetical protein